MTHATTKKASGLPEKSASTVFFSSTLKSVKTAVLFLLLVGSANIALATSYTTAAAGDPADKANWTPVPQNFNTQGDTWNIVHHMTIASTWSVMGNVTINPSGSINDNGNTVYFGGHFTNNNPDTSSYTATGTAVFNSEFPQAIGGTAVTTFNNLTRSNNGLSFNSNCKVTGNFTGKSFIVDGGNTVSFGGNFTVATGNNLFTGTTVFNGKGAQAVTGNPEFNNLTVTNPTGLALSSNETIKGDLTLNDATLTDGGNAVSVAGNITGTGKATGTGGITVTGSSATISGATIDNLTLNNPLGFSLTGNTTINGALTFKAGALAIGANTLTLNGTVSGMNDKNYLTGSDASNLTITTTHALGTLYFNQATPGTTNNVATLSMNGADGIVTLGSSLSVSTTLSLTAGTIADGGNTISLSGNVTGTGIESGTGGISMKGASATISGATISKLAFDNAAEFSLTGSPVITGSLVFNAGTLTIGNNTLTINGTVSGMSDKSYVTGSASSNLTIGSSAAVGTLFFDQSADGVSNNIAVFNLKGTGYCIVKLGNKLVSGTSVTLSKGQLQINDQTLELNGTFDGNAKDNIQGSASSNLIVNAKANEGPLFFDQAGKGTTNNLATFTINGAGETITLGSPLSISAGLALNSGTLADGGNAIMLGGNITGTGSEAGTGGISATGAAPAISGVTLTNLTVNTASGVSLTGNLVINGALAFAAGTLNIGNNTLTLNGTVSGMSAKNCFTGSQSSNLTVGSTGPLGSVYFDQTQKGITNALAACNVNNESCAVTFASPIAVGSFASDKKGHKKHKNRG